MIKYFSNVFILGQVQMFLLKVNGHVDINCLSYVLPEYCWVGKSAKIDWLFDPAGAKMEIFLGGQKRRQWSV